MPGPQYIVISSGSAASAPFTIDRPASALAVLVPSMTATDIRIEYATASGTGFAPLVRDDGSGAVFTAYSGAGPAVAIVPHVATARARLFSVTTQTDARTYQIGTIVT